MSRCFSGFANETLKFLFDLGINNRKDCTGERICILSATAPADERLFSEALADDIAEGFNLIADFYKFLINLQDRGIRF